MNQDWQEKRLRRLFRELGREDERNAPGFEGVLRAALARGSGRGPHLWRLAAIAALPVLAVGVSVMLLVNRPTRPDPPGDFTTLQTIPLRRDLTPDSAVEPTSPESTKPAIKASTRGRRKQASTTHNSSLLISQWRSPTDSLLKIPGNELLKSIPRVPNTSPGITKSLFKNHN